MKAQEVYDLQKKYEFCSGKELHKFFSSACGDPSPPGEQEIDTAKTIAFVFRHCRNIEANSGDSMEACKQELIAGIPI